MLDPVKDIQGQIMVDLLGVIWTTRAVLPQMYRQGSGHIINMSSLAGWAAPPLYTVYSAAKFGVRGFTEALRREASPFGVKVSAIYPGSAATEFQTHIGRNQRSSALRPCLALPLGRGCRSGGRGTGKTPASKLDPALDDGILTLCQLYFTGRSDSVQSKAFKPYHQEDRKKSI